jgi:hypothetical protein
LCFKNPTDQPLPFPDYKLQKDRALHYYVCIDDGQAIGRSEWNIYAGKHTGEPSDLLPPEPLAKQREVRFWDLVGYSDSFSERAIALAPGKHRVFVALRSSPESENLLSTNSVTVTVVEPKASDKDVIALFKHEFLRYPYRLVDPHRAGDHSPDWDQIEMLQRLLANNKSSVAADNLRVMLACQIKHALFLLSQEVYRTQSQGNERKHAEALKAAEEKSLPARRELLALYLDMDLKHESMRAFVLGPGGFGRCIPPTTSGEVNPLWDKATCKRFLENMKSPPGGGHLLPKQEEMLARYRDTVQAMLEKLERDE